MQDQAMDDTKTEDTTTAATTPTPEASQKSDITIPKARLDEEIAKRRKIAGQMKELEAQLAKLQEERKQAERAKMTEAERMQAELEELRVAATRAEELSSKVASYEEQWQALLEVEISGLPEDQRTLVSEMPGDAASKVTWLRRAREAGLLASATPTPVTTPGRPGVPVARPAPPAKSLRDLGAAFKANLAAMSRRK